MPLALEEVVSQDNSLHTYISIKFPLYNAARVPYAICGISTDITALKQAEDALRSSVATNQALLNAIPDLMFRISKDGTFVNFKAAKTNNLLVSGSEFLGKHLYELLPTEIVQLAMHFVDKALQTGEVQIIESQLLVNKNLLDYEFRIAISAEDEVIAIVRDITKRKQAEADIRTALEKEKELSDLKSRFVTMASHEFRTPLTTILSSAALVEKYSHKLAEEKKLQHLQRIQAAVRHMTHLLDDVLLIGKAEAGKLELKPTPLALVQFCRELVEEMQLTTSTHIIAFRTQEQCINACMDEKLLRHIFSNLLSNAIKYSPQGGNVDFQMICKQEAVIFHIQDQGIGIPVADQAQLFNSFQRASNVGTISGTGLGLAIVKKSVDLHGGKIAVESEVGAGTTFTVTIPLQQQDVNR
jgi:signal transduction histidine kinase